MYRTPKLYTYRFIQCLLFDIISSELIVPHFATASSKCLSASILKTGAMKTKIISLLALAIASITMIVPTVHLVKATGCSYSTAAQSTGKITCTPGGYTLNNGAGGSITCSGGVRTVTANGHTVIQSC